MPPSRRSTSPRADEGSVPRRRGPRPVRRSPSRRLAKEKLRSLVPASIPEACSAPQLPPLLRRRRIAEPGQPETVQFLGSPYCSRTSRRFLHPGAEHFDIAEPDQVNSESRR